MSSSSTGLGRRSALGALAALGASLGCSRQEPDVRVDLSRTSDSAASGTQSVWRFAVGTMLAPREMIRDYQKLADHLASRIGHAIEIVQRRGYAKTNALLEDGTAEFGFICTGAYVSIKPEPPEILAVPVVNGKLTYASYIIVHESDPATDLQSLRGSSFAYVDPLSLTGRIYPEWAARQVAGSMNPLFAETFFTYSHSQSLALVASGRVRAAGVDSVVFEQFTRSEPSRTKALRILRKSPEFGMPPFVAGFRLAPAHRHLLRKTLLKLHLSREGLEVLAAVGFDRFALPDPGSYRPAIRMQTALLDVDAGLP
jgi:phosphonate transport system substrate-binding protein